MNYLKASLLASFIPASQMATMMVRNIIFAKLLSPDNFAIAMTFGVVLWFFESTSNFGYENLMQRSPNGNLKEFQSTLHSTLILRGVFVSILIILSAPLISILVKVPPDIFNFAYLAIIPLINALSHTDHMRLHRDHSYIMSAKIAIFSDISSIAVALGSALILPSYWGFFISFIYRQIIGTLLSHIWAVRPYRLGFYKKYLIELWVFGLPILLVMLLRYLGKESDKALIVHFTGLTNFASYFISVMVVSGIVSLSSTGLSKIFIRRISVRKAVDSQAECAHQNGVILLYAMLPVITFLTLAGEPLISILFGTAFTPLPYLIPAISLLVCFRTINSWLGQTVMACDSTAKILIADCAGLSGLVVALISAYYFQSALIICLAYCIGEFIYFVVLTLQLSLYLKRFYIRAIKLLTVSLNTTLLAVIVYFLILDSPVAGKVMAAVCLSGLVLLGFFLCSYTCKRQTDVALGIIFNTLHKKN